MDTKIFFNLKKKNLKKKEAFPHLAVEISGYILLTGIAAVSSL